MRDGWLMINCLPKNEWNCKSNPNSLSVASLPSLGGLSFFILLWWVLYSDIVISNMYAHFHHRLFIGHVLFNPRVFVICTLPLPYLPYCLIFFVLWYYCDVAFNPISIVDRSKLSLVVRWEKNWGTKPDNWPSCSNKGIREEKS